MLKEHNISIPEKKALSQASSKGKEEPAVHGQQQQQPASLTNNQAFVQNLRNLSDQGKMSGLFELLHGARPLDAAEQAPADVLKRN